VVKKVACATVGTCTVGWIRRHNGQFHIEIDGMRSPCFIFSQLVGDGGLLFRAASNLQFDSVVLEDSVFFPASLF